MLVSAHGRPRCSADSIADPVTVGDPWQPIGRPCCSADSIADLVADGHPGKIGRPYCSADAVADVFAADAKTDSGANDDA